MNLDEYTTEVRETARTLGISEPATEAVVDLIRPHIELFRQDGGTAGQLGGRPALSEDTPWPFSSYRLPRPNPVPFAASVNFSQLPLEVLDVEVPRDGHLLLFAGLDSDDDRGAMMYVPAGTNATERQTPENFDVDVIQRSALGARVGWSLPYREPLLEDLYSRSSDGHPYHHPDFRRLLSDLPLADDRLIQIGGYVDSPQEHPLYLVEDAYQDWTVLAKMTVRDGFRNNSEEELHRYGDPDPDGFECCFFWTLRKSDLAAKRFDRVETQFYTFN